MPPITRFLLRAAVCWVCCAAVQAQTSAPVVHPSFPTGVTTSLGGQVATLLSDSKAARAHWGIAVTELDGTPIYGLDEGKLFRPASNAKLFTTAAAMAMLGPEKHFSTTVIAEGKLERGKLRGDVVLHGGGDATFASGYALPYLRPALRPKDQQTAPPLADIEDLAAQVTAKGVHEISGDIVGDETYFDYTPYPDAWGMDDQLWGYGAPVSALTVHDNQVSLTITPAAAGHGAGSITIVPDVPFYRVNPVSGPQSFAESVQTVDWGRAALQNIERAPGTRGLHVYGDVKPGQGPVHEELAISDPAEYAAAALRAALERHGVRVRGQVKVRRHSNHDVKPLMQGVLEPLPMTPGAQDATFGPGHVECQAQAVAGPLAPERTTLAEHQSPPLLQDVVLTAKVSQNLHAEVMLRNIGAEKNCYSTLANSLQVVRQFWTLAGIDGEDFIFYDGSGLSTHDLVTPRAIAQLLAFSLRQPWFEQWKAALPVGGQDGSLGARFKDPPLKDHVFAKTGTLGETRALSGYLDCASGKQVIFSVMVDDHTPVASNDREVMDKIVAAIAANE